MCSSGALAARSFRLGRREIGYFYLKVIMQGKVKGRRGKI